MDSSAEISAAFVRFARKVRHEGGVLEAIDYGIPSSDVPDEETARAWAQIEELYAAMRPLISRVEQRIEVV